MLLSGIQAFRDGEIKIAGFRIETCPDAIGARPAESRIAGNDGFVDAFLQSFAVVLITKKTEIRI